MNSHNRLKFNFILTLIFFFIPLFSTNTVNAAGTEKTIKFHDKITLADQREIFIELSSINKTPGSVFDLQGFSQVAIKDSKSHLLDTFKFNTPNVSFKTYRISGLPAPLILFAVVNDISASSAFYSIYPFTIVGKQLKLLHPALKLDTYSSGFYFGTLTHHQEINAIFWKFIWDDNDTHVGPHRYSIKLYHWNGQSFVLLKNLITKDKYVDGTKALKAYGFVIPDLSLNFSNLNDFR